MTLRFQIETNLNIEREEQKYESRLKNLRESKTEVIKEDKIQKEKDIWKQEKNIQKIVIGRIYGKRMNKVV